MVNYTNPGQVTGCKITPVPITGQTRSGYGGQLPTRYMIRYGAIWHRVKVMCYGNAGTPYIVVGGEILVLDTDTEYGMMATCDCDRAGNVREDGHRLACGA